MLRLYESLCSQTNKDFEWLVVDDGSTDGTEEYVNSILELAKELKIYIHYVKQENGGKHRAYNLALQEARGELFFCVDSDDWLPVEAVERILNASQRIIQRTDVIGIVGYKTLESGNLICDCFPTNLQFSNFTELRRRNIKGEYSIIFKTDIARNYLFPTVEGETFMPESVVYDNIDKNYKYFYIKEVLTICEYQPDGLSGNPYQLMIYNPGGYKIFYSQRINSSDTLKERILAIIHYHAFSYMFKKSLCDYSGRFNLLVKAIRPLGYMAYCYYKMKIKS